MMMNKIFISLCLIILILCCHIPRINEILAPNEHLYNYVPSYTRTSKVALERKIEANITFYCACKTCNGNTHGITASGKQMTVGQTIAVDPKIIPLGTAVHIEGIGDRIAEDTGSAIKGNRVDVLVRSHQEALSRGRLSREVIIKR